MLIVPPPPQVNYAHPIVILRIGAAACALGFIALVAGYFIFPRSWRDSAAAILLMVGVILLPIVMRVRSG